MRRLLLVLAALLLLPLLPLAARADALTVFAAASLTNVIGDVQQLWQAEGHAPFRASFAASSTLARQIEQGAPANLFASADTKWMDYLASRNLIVADTRRNLLGNDLVLIVPADHPAKLSIGPGFDLAALLGAGGRLAVGDPAHVPAGIYAEQALRKLGLWDVAAPRLARTEDVRGALLLVERGETPAGIVYGTDAAVSGKVAVAGTFPADSHPPIVYPFAVIASGDTAEARALLAFLAGPQARAAFVKRGFRTEQGDP
jgi:molybdate transport system substrate-binding protein